VVLDRLPGRGLRVAQLLCLENCLEMPDGEFLLRSGRQRAARLLRRGFPGRGLRGTLVRLRCATPLRRRSTSGCGLFQRGCWLRGGARFGFAITRSFARALRSACCSTRGRCGLAGFLLHARGVLDGGCRADCMRYAIRCADSARMNVKRPRAATHFALSRRSCAGETQRANTAAPSSATMANRLPAASWLAKL